MKFLVLLGDGMADFPLEQLDGRTPLQAAQTPALDALATSGATGLCRPIPAGFAPGSDVGNLALFGYDPHIHHTGRGPIEAASMGVPVPPNHVAIRCNLVATSDGHMTDFTAGHISTQEAAPLLATLDEALRDQGARFHAGVSYRHLAIVDASQRAVEDFMATHCTPPHDITGQPYEPHLPHGPASAYLRALMEASVGVLGSHPVNARRIAAQKLPATSIWLWGQGGPLTLETYAERFGLTGAVVSAVDLVRGLGVAAGLEVLEVPGATGYLDTNYEGKASAALEALERLDFVCLHVEAPDEASHEGRPDLKIKAIEDFDARIVAPCLAWAHAQGNCRVLAVPDHVTSTASRTHADGPVPFAVCGPGVTPDGARAYTEKGAAATGLIIDDAHLLLPHLITASTVDLAGLQSRRSIC